MLEDFLGIFYHAELIARGVAIVESPVTQWWGDRMFSIVDAAGDALWFWKAVAEMNPPPGLKIV